MFYSGDALKAAGVDPAQLQDLTWNPQDGGTFEKLIAHLTIDTKGVRGDQPGFDKTHVKTYGLGSDGSGGNGWGQTQWSAFTGSAGWQATDKNPWGTHFNLDQPAYQDTLKWYFGLARKGYMPSFAEIGGNNPVGPDKQIQSGIAAMALSGSWMISTFSNLTDAKGKKLDIGLAPTPIGPSGKRASMFNGLADSVTTLSKQPENAAKWVKFLSGEQCQDIIGQSGVVFPARPKATDLAIAYNKEKRHLDVTPFTQQVAQGTTFLFPVTTNAADITALMQPRLDSVYIGSSPVTSMTTLNTQLNNLFKVAQ
jgi:multiple sugar transport system substrate-binding protein